MERRGIKGDEGGKWKHAGNLHDVVENQSYLFYFYVPSLSAGVSGFLEAHILGIIIKFKYNSSK